jgi:hypothetical protein
MNTFQSYAIRVCSLNIFWLHSGRLHNPSRASIVSDYKSKIVKLLLTIPIETRNSILKLSKCIEWTISCPRADCVLEKRIHEIQKQKRKHDNILQQPYSFLKPSICQIATAQVGPENGTDLPKCDIEGLNLTGNFEIERNCRALRPISFPFLFSK